MSIYVYKHARLGLGGMHLCAFLHRNAIWTAYDVHMNKKVQDRSVKFSPLAEMLHLKQDVYGYSYLSESGCSYVLTMDDDKQFTITTVSCFVKLSPLKHLSYM